MPTASAAGFYGKLPCNGDFLLRRTAPAFLDVWDPWLQACMVASRGQLGDGWLDRYLAGPVWRFALAAGLCGEGAYAGLLLPSVDRVGRCFPLTLLVELSLDECIVDTACDVARPWFDSAESLAIAAVQDPSRDLEQFDADLCALAAQISSPQATESPYFHRLMRRSEFARHPAQWLIPMLSPTSLQRAVNCFALRELERTLRPLTLWWTRGSQAMAACCLCTRGLPLPESFAGMLVGEWSGSAWELLDTDPENAVRGELPMSRPCEGHGPLGRDPPGETTLSPDFRTESEREVLEITFSLSVPACAAEGEGEAGVIVRPQLGIWGLCRGAPARGDHARAIENALDGLAPVGSLTGLVEEIRRALANAKDGTDADRAFDSGVRIVLFLARGDECALVCSGEVQAVGIRRAGLVKIPDAPAPEAVAVPSEAAAADTALQSLMELVAAPVERIGSIVRYEPLQAGDVWLLAADSSIPPEQLVGIARMLAAASPGGEPDVATATDTIEGGPSPYPGMPALMLLAARAIPAGGIPCCSP